MGFEFGAVASVGAPGRTSGYLYFFEHGVHDGLCAHDLAGLEVSIQDGIAGRLRPFNATTPSPVYRSTLASAPQTPRDEAGGAVKVTNFDVFHWSAWPVRSRHTLRRTRFACALSESSKRVTALI